MNVALKNAIAATLLVGSSFAATAPAEARYRHGNNGAAIAAGIVGLGVGAALASDRPYYAQSDYYGYAPAEYYAPAPVAYYGGYDYYGGYGYRGHYGRYDHGDRHYGYDDRRGGYRGRDHRDHDGRR